MIAGGVVLYSTNEFLTISMLPSTINEIGGERIYAWVTTLYLVGSVVAAATVNTLLHRIGACVSYLVGFAVLGVGSLVCAAAPNMEILLVGRFLQGLAGGLLCGLSFAVINAVLPRSLWSRGLGHGGLDVGYRCVGRPRDGWSFRTVRRVAVGVRPAGDAERGDGRAGAGPAVHGRRRDRSPTAPRPGSRCPRSSCWAPRR